MTLAELEGIANNQSDILLYIDNSTHPVVVYQCDGFPEALEDYEVTDIYPHAEDLIICIEKVEN